jgi:hypothetical protein
LCVLHQIQWDKVEIIHREENRFTTDVRELVVMTAREKQTIKPIHELLLLQEKNNLSRVLTEFTLELCWWSRG